MFGIKTFVRNNIFYPKALFPKTHKFPEKPVSSIRINMRLWGLVNQVKDQKKHAGLGNLVTYPEEVAVNVWNSLLPLNPNNLGNWSIKNSEPNHETGKIERDLIHQMIDLYHGDKEKLEGYVTSGGTEANIFSAWLGREQILSKGITIDQICLLETSLTHYSLEKAANIVGVPSFIVALNEKSWAMDRESFEKEIEKLTKKGFKGFLVPLTMGYTVTGTVDPYEEICKLSKKLERKYKIKLFIWLDGALNGLIEPFLNKNFRLFNLPEIQTFLIDFHKFGYAPVPSGIILYKKNLRKLIEKPIDYLSEFDSTLLGSRSGIAPVACWAIINTLGKNGFKKIIDKNFLKKKKFIEKIGNQDNIKIITGERSLNCGLIFNSGTVDSQFLAKYGLISKKMAITFVTKKVNYLISKAFFF